MKVFLAVLVFLAPWINAADAQVAGEAKPRLYDPQANAQEQIGRAVARARKERKNVLLQVGGNWCIWCTRFEGFVSANDTLRRARDTNYVTVHVNYSPENKNVQTLARLGYPQRFGFPVFVILDAAGNRIHTQNSAYLEEGKGYSREKVLEFFSQWSPAAIAPETYTELR